MNTAVWNQSGLNSIDLPSWLHMCSHALSFSFTVTFDTMKVYLQVLFDLSLEARTGKQWKATLLVDHCDIVCTQHCAIVCHLPLKWECLLWVLFCFIRSIFSSNKWASCVYSWCNYFPFPICQTTQLCPGNIMGYFAWNIAKVITEY